MRRVFLGLALIALVGGPFSFAKDKEKDRETTERAPIFMDPDFQFSNVQTICLAPTLDLRTDKSVQLFSIDTADRFKGMGHEIARCDAVSATSLNDLTAPSDAFLHKLNFGQSNWLFVLAVETVKDFHKTAHTWSDVYAVLSGFLFEKRADTARLVWWDRGMGASGNVMYPGMFWQSERKVREATSSTEIGTSVGIGVNRLTAPFNPVRRKHAAVYFAIHEDNFGEPCDAVWPALKDALDQDPKKFHAAVLDDSTRTALYLVGHKRMAIYYDENDVSFRTQNGGCEMQIQLTTSLHFGSRAFISEDNWKDLIKHMRVALAK